MSKSIDKKEFYKRFAGTIPGEAVPGTSLKKAEADIYFEHFSMAGLKEMHKYSVDERLYEFFEFKPFISIEETKAYLEKLIGRMSGSVDERTTMYWFVRRKTDGHLVGTAGLVGLNYGRRSVEWGYGVDPELWGNGYILQIQEILKQYAFEVLELNRLDGVTMIHNERTISSLLAAGMKHEGTLRDFYCKDGVFYDGWKYAMLRKDYLEETHQSSVDSSVYTRNDVINIISSVLDEEHITEDSTMFNTASWDSLNHMSIMVALFEKTKIRFSPIQISNATSVPSITQLLNSKSGLNK